MDEFKELKKYNEENHLEKILFGFALLAFGFFYTLLSSLRHGLPIFSVLFGIIFIIIGITEPFRYQGMLNKLRDEGEMPDILSDFRIGSRVCDEKIILGEGFIIGNKNALIIKYEAINSVKHESKSSASQKNVRLSVTTKDGKSYILCNLQQNELNDNDIARIVDHIVSKNPLVNIEY